MTNLMPQKFHDFLNDATDEQADAFRQGTLDGHMARHCPFDRWQEPDLWNAWHLGWEWQRHGLLTDPEDRVSHGSRRK